MFRFAFAIALVLGISLIGTIMESRNLDWRRRISHQHYRKQVLENEWSKWRVTARREGTPERRQQNFETEPMGAIQGKATSPRTGPSPLARWDRPADPRLDDKKSIPFVAEHELPRVGNRPESGGETSRQ